MYEAKGLTKRCNPNIHIRRVPEVSAHSGHTAGTTPNDLLFRMRPCISSQLPSFQNLSHLIAKTAQCKGLAAWVATRAVLTEGEDKGTGVEAALDEAGVSD